MEFTVGQYTIPAAFKTMIGGIPTPDPNTTGKFGLGLVCQEAEMTQRLNE